MTTTKKTLDLSGSAKLSEAAKTRYDAMPQEEIDYSEAPDMGDVDWSALKIEHPRSKPTVTMRLDEGTINFFKQDDPKGFTARMAAVLNAYARAHITGC